VLLLLLLSLPLPTPASYVRLISPNTFSLFFASAPVTLIVTPCATLSALRNAPALTLATIACCGCVYVCVYTCL
jgi:hypothetical protein